MGFKAKRRLDIHILKRRPRSGGRVHIEWNEYLRFRTHAVILLPEGSDDNRGNNGNNYHNENSNCQETTRALRLKAPALAHVFFGAFGHIKATEKENWKWMESGFENTVEYTIKIWTKAN
jgi:hypothetical protein